MAEEFVFPEYDNPGRVMVNGGRGGLNVYLQENRAVELDRCIFFESDEFIVIYDAYPKSNIHLLIMSKGEYIKNVCKLYPEHLPCLRGMIDLANEITSHFEKLGIEIWQGFHAIPSLAPLHLHLISTDFSAPALKKPIHWNSFVTEFFLDPESVYEELYNEEIVYIDKKYYKKLKNTDPMTCPKCKRRFKIGRIKSHWKSCKVALQPIDRRIVYPTR